METKTKEKSNNQLYEAYFKDISGFPLLSTKEEKSLGKKVMEENCEESLNTLINCNLRLVVTIANSFINSNHPHFMDIISEGNLGLRKAALKFDPTRGVKFSSYASWWIKQAMRRHLINSLKTVRVPIQTQNKIKLIKKIRSEFILENGREPFDFEICEITGLTQKRLDGIKPSLNYKIEYLDDIIKDSSDDQLTKRDKIIGDYLAGGEDMLDELDYKEKMAWLNRAFKIGNSSFFTERNCMIVRMRYGIGYDHAFKLWEISEAIGITRERARQICSELERRLKILAMNEINR